ncbi:WD domain G-beta repeat uncharacterized protein [Kribbella voronezhensis]|uniref:WD domain G-beta repeat uncharacterized protein n=1 Tax=Kribbella voronezhensis TaxID=2512212 RepID=A0A4R7SYY1_9ACTN|nr:P-loop NTPase fold protein [Kribbella voronezhensis]TDU83738.1 WD domain G-beta repeat uncharacterized protein [Kribbella voronezhensis]
MSTPKPFAGHQGAVRAIAVFPDGSRIVTGGDDAKIRLWDLRTGLLLAEHDEHRVHNDRVLALAVTENERVISCGRSVTVDWDVAGNVTTTTPHATAVADIAISARGDAIAAIDIAGNVVQPADSSGWPSEHERIDKLAVTTNGQLITAGIEPLVRITDRSGNELGRLDGRTRSDVAMAASAEGERIVYVTHGRVQYWNRRPASRPVRLTGCEDAVTVAVTPDDRQVIAGGFGGGLWAWDPDAPTEPIAMQADDSPIRSLAVTPDCRQLVSGAENGAIRIWDLTTGAEVSPGRTPRPQAGLTSDQESALDLLDFAEDVDSLAALITDRETDPPLAIALLGRWGSGKSSFLRQLQDSVARLTEQGRQNPARSVFTTAVRQVRFDAWHYNDDQLWVGLVEHLFAGLADPSPANVDEVRAERDAVRHKLRDLEALADPKTPAVRRTRARLRLWSASLKPWRRRIALAGTTAVLLGVVTWLTWRSSGNNLLAWTLGALTAVSASPIVDRLIAAWRAVRGLAGRRTVQLDQSVRATRMRLANLDAAERLALAIEDARAGGYDQYRGVLGHVHADLRRLSDSAQQAFGEWSRAGSSGAPPLERVILYIDDLDRCSPRKVVDVLAAVHLLLALPLFVVVVAVDPRWLRRCLEQYHTELFGGPDSTGTSPLDYLDKIFQVVFALRPMGSEADRFVAALVPTDLTAVPGRTPGPGTPKPGAPASAGTTATGKPQVSARPARQAANPQPHQLRLREEELQFVQRLRPLLETPRALKRFVNLYRLVRSAVAEKDLDDFIGADATGPYQAVLVLLAILVSAPEDCRTLTTALRESAQRGTVTDLFEELERTSAPGGVWTRLRSVLRAGDPVHDNLATYRRWAGTVTRFSFETWDLTEPR